MRKLLFGLLALLWPLQVQAAISFIGSCEASSSSNADATCTLPAMSQNDLVLCAGAIGDNDGVDQTMAMITAGYTTVPGADIHSDDTQDVDLAVFYKFMGATPDTTAVFDGVGGTDAAAAVVCMVFRGVNTVTPFDVAAVTATAIDTMHPNPDTVDWITSGTWVYIAGASGHTLLGAGTYTFPTGYTTNAIDRGHDDTSDVTVGAGYNTSPADPENPGIMTHSGTDSTSFSSAAVTIALREFVAPICTAGLNMTLLGVGGCP